MNTTFYKDRYTKNITIKNVEPVFKKIESIGGRNGWMAYDALWQLRGLIDKLVGGHGMRGRKDNHKLEIGDYLDFWKVEDITPNERLLLAAQMKVPGEAWLEFQTTDKQLIETLYFNPDGLFGKLYWYSMLPFHKVIFHKLLTKLLQD